ncbi:MAG: 50S ribosomal protein L15 [Bacteroidota bacterium]|nr:50S ribosomal protein L15 [Bacteroidota bacterium]
MKLNKLKPAAGSIKKPKRIGRGEGSKKGGTSTRGHKGAKSRSGYSRKFGFEGGQQPLQRRVPKFGFTNPNRKEYKVINIDFLQYLLDNKKVKKGVITKEFFIENRLIKKKDRVKILGRGKITGKIELTVESCSKSAKEAIEKAGGKVNIIS